MNARLLVATVALVAAPAEAAPLTLSYQPTCRPHTSCLAGTEIQALETFDGRLYAGTTNWMETNERVWPRTSAQVLALDKPEGAWRALAPLPDPQKKCKPGVAPWEQVNDLQRVSYGATSKSALLVSTMPNEDGGCPSLQGTVFYLGPDQKWIDTGLGNKLMPYYGSLQSETRYVVSHVDSSGECTASKPCVFAFVGPRGKRTAGIGATVWRGRIDPQKCSLICWDSSPEAELNGAKLPNARRILSAYSAGDKGVFIGTGLTQSPAPKERVALLQRNAHGVWKPIWKGGTPTGEREVRGIVGWTSPAGQFSLWFVTNPLGSVYRSDLKNGRLTAPKREVRLVDVPNQRCTDVYGYQLYLHGTDNPVLAFASQSCPGKQRTARIFYRHLESCTKWRSLELPNLRDPPTNGRVNETALRWFERSPWDPNDIYVGTTDMNSGPGSLTARIYRLTRPFAGTCP